MGRNEDYRILETSDQLQEVLEAGWCWQADTGLDVVAIAEDTENTPDGRPFNLSISMQPGTGYIIMADRRDLLAVSNGSSTTPYTILKSPNG